MSSLGIVSKVLGTVSKLSVVFKRLNFKQCLIYTWLNFQNDGFDSKFYFLVEKQQHYIKQFCLKLHSSLNNVVLNSNVFV